MPTLAEIGEELGLTPAEQDFLIHLVDEKGLRRPTQAARKKSSISSRSIKTSVNGATGSVRKDNSRVRANA
jgi:hypothetical protein